MIYLVLFGEVCGGGGMEIECRRSAEPALCQGLKVGRGILHSRLYTGAPLSPR